MSGNGKKHRIGVIGAGARGETFARQLASGSQRAQLAGVCDIDDDRLRRFCEYCGIPDAAQCADPHEFVNSDALDGVIVTVPEFCHAEVACEALAAGKHVYMEKPLAHTMADCYRIERAACASEAVCYLGFNMRASPLYRKLKEIVASGVLGRILHVSALEQLARDHVAAFMRRWHRRESRSGGLLNTKASHDLDIIQWVIGHEHAIARVASFGGNDVFGPEKAPPGHGTHCGNCPAAVRRDCGYADKAGFFFPVRGERPMHKTRQADIYGNDLCVYNDDKDIVDNQTLIFEWDNGVRGNFNLQTCQSFGTRRMMVWGELGRSELTFDPQALVRVTASATGDTAEYRFAPRSGGHGGVDPFMLDRFLDAIEGDGAADSGVSEGLAATLLAIKADEARKSGKVVEIDPGEYAAPAG